jgi:hypothetical protein
MKAIMEEMELNIFYIYIGGVLTLILALFHTQFYRFFRWKAELDKLTLVNRRIIYTVHIALLLIFFGIGFATLVFAKDLSAGSWTAQVVNLLLSLFWLWRWAWQILYFKPAPGKKPSGLHYVMVVWFLLLFLSYFIPVMNNLY